MAGRVIITLGFYQDVYGSPIQPKKVYTKDKTLALRIKNQNNMIVIIQFFFPI